MVDQLDRRALAPGDDGLDLLHARLLSVVRAWGPT